jgi:hypothetical protein
MKDPNIEEMLYSDVIDDMLESRVIDDDSIDYDDLSFGALLDSSNDF